VKSNTARHQQRIKGGGGFCSRRGPSALKGNWGGNGLGKGGGKSPQHEVLKGATLLGPQGTIWEGSVDAAVRWIQNDMRMDCKTGSHPIAKTGQLFGEARSGRPWFKKKKVNERGKRVTKLTYRKDPG